MHIAPRTGDRCFKETGAGLLKVLMCDCITSAFYLMIILVSGDSLDIKELTSAIIINVCIYLCAQGAAYGGPRQRCAYSLNVLLYID